MASEKISLRGLQGRWRECYGKDIDLRCAKMTALNMYFFDLNSFIQCGNGLRDEWSVGWKTRKGGFIYEIFPTHEVSEKQSAATQQPKTPALNSGTKSVIQNTSLR